MNRMHTTDLTRDQSEHIGDEICDRIERNWARLMATTTRRKLVRPGRRIIVQRLTNRPELNGAFGLVTGYNSSRERFEVSLDQHEEQLALHSGGDLCGGLLEIGAFGVGRVAVLGAPA